MTSRSVAGLLGTALLLGGCATAPRPAFRPAASEAELFARVEGIASASGGRMGFVAVHLESGRRYERLPDVVFEGASVVKLALLVEAVARDREGTLDLSDRWTVTPAAMAAGSGILDEFRPGLQPTYRDLLRLMITISDNTAANVFVDRFGAAAVNSRMERLGLPGIRLVGRIPDRDPAETETERWKGLALGRMTPRDTAELYRRIAEGSLVDPEASRLALELLSWPRSLDRLFRSFRGEEKVSWAGKSGTMRSIRGDSGILTTRKGTFVLAAFVDGFDEDEGGGPRANTAMADVAHEVVASWSASLPDRPEPPPRVAWPPEPAPSTGRLGLSLAEARAGGVPELSRVFRPADRAFWELWERSGGSAGDACLVPSPNSWWEENDPHKIEPVSSILVHHTGSETDQRCVGLFLDPGTFVASHFLVGRDGRLYQFVSLEHRAWHAGTSYLHGERALNRSSVGIEITGDGNRIPFTKEQVEAATRLVGVLVALFDVKAPFVVGHQHVAPDRKPDPGVYFPWNDVVRDALELAARLEPLACPARLSIGARPLGMPLPDAP